MKQKGILGNGILKLKEVKKKERNNFMIASAFSRKDGYDRRVSQKIYAQSLYPSIKVFCLAMLRRWFVIINGRVALSHKKCTILVVFFFFEESLTGLRKVEDNFFLCSSMAVSGIFEYSILLISTFCGFNWSLFLWVFFLQNHEHISNLQTIKITLKDP